MKYKTNGATVANIRERMKGIITALKVLIFLSIYNMTKVMIRARSMMKIAKYTK